MFKWSRVARMNGATENGFIRPTRVPYKVLYALLFTVVVVLTALLLPSDFRRRPMGDPNLLIIEEEFALYSYNRTYPLTPPTRKQGLQGCIVEPLEFGFGGWDVYFIDSRSIYIHNCIDINPPILSMAIVAEERATKQFVSGCRLLLD